MKLYAFLHTFRCNHCAAVMRHFKRDKLGHNGSCLVYKNLIACTLSTKGHSHGF